MGNTVTVDLTDLYTILGLAAVGLAFMQPQQFTLPQVCSLALGIGFDDQGVANASDVAIRFTKSIGIFTSDDELDNFIEEIMSS